MNLKFSSPLVNSTEKHTIDGVDYTRFFTNLTTNFKVGEKVYILNGNFDNSFNNYEGYTVIDVNDTKVTLDIPYDNKLPYNKDDYSEYTTVELVDSIDKFNYINTDNGYGIEGKLGKKYSDKNNSIFISQIENMPLTTQQQTKDVFFKSFENLVDVGDYFLDNTKGENFKSGNTLSVNMLEGNSSMNTPFIMSSGYDISRDVDVNSNYIASVFADTNDNRKIWLWNKTQAMSTSQYFFEMVGLDDVGNIETENFSPDIIKTLQTEFSNLNPNRNTTGYRLYFYGNSLSDGIDLTYLIINVDNPIEMVEEIAPNNQISATIANNFVLGNNDVDSTDKKILGFYDTTNSQPVITTKNSPQNQIIGTTINSAFTTASELPPYFLMKDDTEVAMMPLGDGRATRRPVNMEEFPFDDFKVNDIEINDFAIDISIDIRGQLAMVASTEKGIVYYNWGGVWINTETDTTYIGNGFYLTKDYYEYVINEEGFDNQFEGIYNPFSMFSNPEIFDDDAIWNITSIKFIGIENINLGIGELPYSKYLVLTETFGYYMYVYDNAIVYRNNVDELGHDISYFDFYDGPTKQNNRFTQAHIKLLPLKNDGANQQYMGLRRLNAQLDTNPTFFQTEVVMGNIDSTNSPYIYEFEDQNGNVVMPNITFPSNDKAIRYIENNNNTWLFSVENTKVLINENNINVDFDTNTPISMGRQLQSNNIRRIRSEVVNDTSRYWFSTDDGLYMLEYTINIDQILYYKVDFDNNKIPLDKSLNRNNRVLIRETFEYDGIIYNKGDILKYNNGRWIKDITHYPAYISNKHFREAFLSSDTIFQDGIYGSYDKRLSFKDTKWESGILFNANYLGGVIQSKSDGITESLEYSTIDGSVITSSNNEGFGFNYFIESSIESGQVQNGNFKNCLIKENHFDNAIIVDSKIESSTLISNVRIKTSNIINSIISDSMILSSTIDNSTLSECDIENKGNIPIIDYQHQQTIHNQELLDIHKFIINEDDYGKVEYSDWVYFDGIRATNDFFTEIFYLLSKTNGFYSSYFDDIKENRKFPYKVFISKSSFNQNKQRLSVGDNGNLIISPQRGFFSIDIITNFTQVGVLDISGGAIQINKILSTKFDDIQWLSGNIINPLELSQDSYTTTYDNGIIQITKNPLLELDWSDILTLNRNVYLYNVFINNVSYADEYTLDDYTLLDNNATTITDDIEATNYKKININLSKIENSIIKAGLFKRQGFNTTIFDGDIKLIDTSIWGDNLNTFTNVSVLNGYFSNQNSANGLNIDAIKSVFINYNVDGGLIQRSNFNGGEFNGEFKESRYNTINDCIDFENSFVITKWENGTFNGGIFSYSVWENGDFNGGRMFFSDFLGGNFIDGQFGTEQGNTTSHRFRKGQVKGGVFINSVFSDRESIIPPISSVYNYVKGGTNIWENAEFNGGVFTSTDGNVSIWKNGLFSNGEIRGEVIWYDGEFKNGLFNSSYGKHFPPIWKYTDIENVSGMQNLSGTTSFGINKGTLLNVSGWEFMNNPYYWGSDKMTLFYDTSTQTIRFIEPSADEGVFEATIANPLASGPFFIFADINNGTHPLSGKASLGTIIVSQEDGQRYIYDGDTFIDEVAFLSQTIPGTSLTYDSLYSWRDGVMSGGEFGVSNNPNGFNPSWENGILKGGTFNGKIWRDGIAISGKFNGSGAEQTQANQENIIEGYNPQQTMINFKSSYIPEIIEDTSLYKNILHWKWFGLWIDGEVSENSSAAIGNIIAQNAIAVDSFNQDKFNTKPKTNMTFDKMLWVDGEFRSSAANFNKSVWLCGKFKMGQFNDSIFNPFVERWDFTNPVFWRESYFEFNRNLDECVWENGYLNSGVFYFSDYKNGTIKKAAMVGAAHKSGRADYLTAYNIIWESGRFRNGNWYGSPFSYFFVPDSELIPTAFGYLENYYQTDLNQTPNINQVKAVSDILSINSMRLKTAQFHIWNKISTDPESIAYNQLHEPQQTNQSVSPISNFKGMVTFIDNIFTTGNQTFFGFVTEATPTGQDRNITVDLDVPFIPNTQQTRIPQGTYRITATTSTNAFLIDGFNSYTFKVTADRYDNNGNFIDNITLNRAIYQGGAVILTPFVIEFTVPLNMEYRLRIEFFGRINTSTGNINRNITLDYNQINQNAKYIDGNNLLDGIVELDFNNNVPFLDNPQTEDSNVSYVDAFGNELSINQRGYKIENIDYVGQTPNVFKINEVYTQFGNGAFLSGIFENGVWNNGYRGTKLGYTDVYIEGQEVEITYANNDTYKVASNPLYFNEITKKPQYRTEPTIIFDDVLRYFKEDKENWRVVLRSPNNINGVDFEEYNRLKPGDIISIGNIVTIDINDNRKLITTSLTVTRIINDNDVEFRFKQTFPIRDIRLDSPRHLITASKNVWLNGAFLNGVFEGIMNRGFVRGNREITKFENTQFINVNFRGGHFKSEKKDIGDSIETNRINRLNTFNNKYRTGLIQHMRFNDDVELSTYQMVSPANVSIIRPTNNGLSREYLNNSNLPIGTNPSEMITSETVQYIYNSDMDLVWEPEYFSSLFNQTILNTHVLNQARIGIGNTTKMYNIPAGHITYDVLSSTSRMTYSLNPQTPQPQQYELSLGSEYTALKTLFLSDFSTNPPEDNSKGVPSTNNVLQASDYGLIKQGISPEYIVTSDTIGTAPGFSTYGQMDQFIHENFMYNINESDVSIGSGDYEQDSFIVGGGRDVQVRDRYHMIEVEVGMVLNSQLQIINPFDINRNITIETEYEYNDNDIPRLTISQDFNGLYNSPLEFNPNLINGYLPIYENDFIPYIDKRLEGEINQYGNISDNNPTITMKTFIENNFGQFRDTIKVLEQNFKNEVINRNSNFDIKSPIYFKFKQTEVDSIPFFNYRDFNDVEGNQTWRLFNNGDYNQKEQRNIDTRVKIPYFAVSIDIEYDRSSFSLIDRINLGGGGNVPQI